MPRREVRARLPFLPLKPEPVRPRFVSDDRERFPRLKIGDCDPLLPRRIPRPRLMTRLADELRLKIELRVVELRVVELREEVCRVDRRIPGVVERPRIRELEPIRDDRLVLLGRNVLRDREALLGREVVRGRKLLLLPELLRKLLLPPRLKLRPRERLPRLKLPPREPPPRLPPNERPPPERPPPPRPPRASAVSLRTAEVKRTIPTTNASGFRTRHFMIVFHPRDRVLTYATLLFAGVKCVGVCLSFQNRVELQDRDSENFLTAVRNVARELLRNLALEAVPVIPKTRRTSMGIVKVTPHNRCIRCYTHPELSDASVRTVRPACAPRAAHSYGQRRACGASQTSSAVNSADLHG